MRFFDTDVMTDIIRDYRPSVDWLISLGEEEIGLPGFVVMELIKGCRNNEELNNLQNLLAEFLIFWPSSEDCGRALNDLLHFHLSHNLGILDALIGECAVGTSAVLCTFNERHFNIIPRLETEQPYEKSRPPQSS